MRISVIVSEAEHAQIKKAAGLVSLSAWIRSIVLEKLNGKKGQK